MSNNKKNKALALAIYDWCVEHEMWDDVIIYFNGKAISTFAKWKNVEGKKIADGIVVEGYKNLYGAAYEYEGKNPCDYFEFGNPKTVSMSFEGSLYNILNYSFEHKYWQKLEEEFMDLFEQHGFYFELGNAWNLSAYEI